MCIRTQTIWDATVSVGPSLGNRTQIICKFWTQDTWTFNTFDDLDATVSIGPSLGIRTQIICNFLPQDTWTFNTFDDLDATVSIGRWLCSGPGVWAKRERNVRSAS